MRAETLRDSVFKKMMSRILLEILYSPHHHAFATTYMGGTYSLAELIGPDIVPDKKINAIVHCNAVKLLVEKQGEEDGDKAAVAVPVTSAFQAAVETTGKNLFASSGSDALILATYILGRLAGELGIDPRRTLYTVINPWTTIETDTSYMLPPREALDRNTLALAYGGGVYSVIIGEKLCNSLVEELEKTIGKRFSGLIKKLKIGSSHYSIPVGTASSLWLVRSRRSPSILYGSKPFSPVIFLADPYSMNTDPGAPLLVSGALGEKAVEDSVGFIMEHVDRVGAALNQSRRVSGPYFFVNPMYTAYVLALLKKYGKHMSEKERRYMEGLAVLAYIRPKNAVAQAKILSYIVSIRSGEKWVGGETTVTGYKVAAVFGGQNHGYVRLANTSNDEVVARLTITGYEEPVLMAYMLSNPYEIVRYIVGAGTQPGNIRVNTSWLAERLKEMEKEQVVPPNNPLVSKYYSYIVGKYGGARPVRADNIPPWYKVLRVETGRGRTIHVVEWISWRGVERLVVNYGDIIPVPHLGEVYILRDDTPPSAIAAVIVPQTMRWLRRNYMLETEMFMAILESMEVSSFAGGAVYRWDKHPAHTGIELEVPKTVYTSLMYVYVEPHDTLAKYGDIDEDHVLRVIDTVSGKTVAEIRSGDKLLPIKTVRSARIPAILVDNGSLLPLTILRPTARLEYIGALVRDNEVRLFFRPEKYRVTISVARKRTA